MGALMASCEVIVVSVVKSPFMAFYFAESEKCHFRFPLKSPTCVASH